MPEALLTVEQAALRLQIRPSTLRRYLREGQIQGTKPGRVWRVPEGALFEPTLVALKPGAAQGRMPKSDAQSRAAAFFAAMREFHEAFKREGCTGLDVDELFRQLRKDRNALI